MWLKPWHVMIGIALIAAFFGTAGFIGYLLYGPGITVDIPEFFRSGTSTSELPIVAEPTPIEEEPDMRFLEEQVGILFECRGGKALKAEFSESNVRLALSDGRVLNLPRIVTEEGEIRFENTDGSFSFRNTEHAVFVQENDVATYAECTSSATN